MTGGIPRGFVVAQAVLPPVAGKHAHRLGAAAAAVFKMHVLHVPVRAQHDPRHQLIADAHRIADGHQLRPRRRILLHVQVLANHQRRCLMGRNFAHVLQVLPVHAAPGNPLVRLCQGNAGHVRSDFTAPKTLFVKSCTGLDGIRLNGLPAERHRHQRIRGQ